MNRFVNKTTVRVAQIKTAMLRFVVELGFSRSLTNANAAARIAAGSNACPVPAERDPSEKARTFLTTMLSWKGILSLLGLAVLAVLIWFSLYLSAMRIYQVDECMETYVAKVLATVQDKAIAGHVTLFQVVLSYLINASGCAIDLLASGRLVMLVVFWINWMLMASATGARVFSSRWIAALAGCATLAPVWDYGFEIRHDNMMLTGLLLLWTVARFGSGSISSCVFAGIVSVALEFVAFKSFAYTLPLSVAMVLFRRPGINIPRWKLGLAWLVGAVGAFVVLRVAFEMMGVWELFKGTNQFLTTASEEGRRFGPGILLKRLLEQAPLLLGLTSAAVLSFGYEVWRKSKSALTWEGNLPEVLLCLGAFGIVIINPAPFPYNVLHLVPYAFILSFRYASGICERLKRPEQWIAFGAILLFTHLVPFGKSTWRHLDWSNTRQEQLMNLSESLTDPVKDPVYDAIGMVSTRSIVDNRAFLHSLNFRNFINGTGPQIRDLLAQRPAAVVIPSYRTDWLPKRDHSFIEAHYVKMADDLWLLGSKLPEGGGTFEIIHPGRYRISTLRESDLAGTYPEGMESLTVPEKDGKFPGTLDGKQIEKDVFELQKGTHHIVADTNCPVAVVWVGPHLDRVHRMPDYDHRTLFFNWY